MVKGSNGRNQLRNMLSPAVDGEAMLGFGEFGDEGFKGRAEVAHGGGLLVLLARHRLDGDQLFQTGLESVRGQVSVGDHRQFRQRRGLHHGRSAHMGDSSALLLLHWVWGRSAEDREERHSLFALFSCSTILQIKLHVAKKKQKTKQQKLLWYFFKFLLIIIINVICCF